ncbi:uncharacterized protein LOC134693721 [Mytilus trossulus]|uniref:uncharacterized protein LOC134693721 n=1 Tax=Mytilus trossulus TaxID=6551 RepID=UPI0030058598
MYTKMIFQLFLILGVFNLVKCHAGFDCYCNLNHPEALIFNCPNGQGFPIAALRLPMHDIIYRDVDLQSPFCVPLLVNIQPQGTWVPVYTKGKLGYLNKDAGFTQMKCPGMLTFSPNSLMKSPICQHHIINTPGLSVTGNQNGGPVTIPTTTTSSPPKTSWIKIPNQPRTPRPTQPAPSTTKLQWIKITYPHRPTPVWQHVGGKGNSNARCYGPDVENDVQKKQSIFYHLSRSCSSNGVAADEVTAAKYCSAPEPKNWIPGKQIYSNCKSIPKYTPISTFTTGTANGDGTAIFLECTQKGTLMVVRQTCKSKMLELVEISPTLDLFVVDW